MDGFLVLVSVVVAIVGSLLLAKLMVILHDREGWPSLLLAPLSLIAALLFATGLAVGMTYFDPNYSLSTLPFWPDGWWSER